MVIRQPKGIVCECLGYFRCLRVVHGYWESTEISPWVYLGNSFSKIKLTTFVRPWPYLWGMVQFLGIALNLIMQDKSPILKNLRTPIHN